MVLLLVVVNKDVIWKSAYLKVKEDMNMNIGNRIDDIICKIRGCWTEKKNT